MVAEKNKAFKPTAFLIIGGIILLITVFVVINYGWESISALFWKVFLFSLLGLAIGLIVYLFIFLFVIKQRFDVNYVNKQRLIEACTLIQRPLIKDLYVTGDKGHSRGLIGSITGYARISILTREYKYKEEINSVGESVKKPVYVKNEQGDQVQEYRTTSEEQDVFVVKKKGLFNFLSEPLVIRVRPEDHDELVGDVNLYGFNLLPIAGYWFLNNDYLDIRRIDHAILNEAKRTIAFTLLDDFKQIVDGAIGIDSRHRKSIESKSLIELPDQQRINQPPNY